MWLFNQLSLNKEIRITNSNLNVPFVVFTACPPQEAPVIISGLAIIDLVAVIGVVYVIVIGKYFLN